MSERAECKNKVNKTMNDTKQRNRKKRQRRRYQNHMQSVLAICAVVLLLAVVVTVKGMAIKEKNKEYLAQQTELKQQIKAEKERTKEIDELDKYVGTDKYIEDVAKNTLGLVYDNEIIFKAK